MTGRLTRWVLIAAAASVGMGGNCHTLGLKQDLIVGLPLGGFGSASRAKFHVDLQRATLLRIMTDSNTGGTKVKVGVRKVPKKLGLPKPAFDVAEGPGIGAGPDKRMTVVGKKDFSFLHAEIDRVFSGPFDARITIAKGSTKGFDHDFPPVATLNMCRPAVPLGDTAESFLQVKAVWDEKTAGFQLAGVSNIGAADVTNPSFDGVTQLDLRIEQTDTQLKAYARPTPLSGADPGGFPWTEVISIDVVPGEDPLRLSFGGERMHKGAVYFFDYLVVDGPNVGGDVERPLMDDIGGVVDSFLDVLLLLNVEPVDVSAGRDALALGLADLDTVIADVKATQDGGTFQSSTQGKRALKALAKAKKRAGSALKLVDADLADPDVDKAFVASKLTIDTVQALVVSIANLNGIPTGSIRKLPFGLPLFD
jgi:hypothetical protein